MNVEFYIENSYKISRLVTREYSTSFSLATSMLERDVKKGIYAIYGFVRLADEIVDSLYQYDRKFLLDKLNEDLQYALKFGISSNTIIVAFADTVKKYNIERMHIEAFMQSMENDLYKSTYNDSHDLDRYIYGSADVVGLMCLKVFCKGKVELYEKLKFSAQKLGSAFQKVNFLRDLKYDIQHLGRSYFPEISYAKFDWDTKRRIQKSIEEDFEDARRGIKQLPGRSRLAVGLAFFYYQTLFLKIKKTSPEQVLKQRIRISNIHKYLIVIKVGFYYKTKLI